MDRHYTPKALAESIVNGLHGGNPELAADFAVGEGALLDAIRLRWPKCQLVATDIDRSAVKRLKSRQPKVSAGVCDFLSERSQRRSPVLNGKQGKIPLIFLNPPFSSRGSKMTIEFEGATLHCSKALAFVILALRYLSTDGRLIALLPSSCMTSERDSSALSWVSRSHIVKLIPTLKPARFTGCSVDVVVVQIHRRKGRCRSPATDATNVVSLAFSSDRSLRASLVRGLLPMSESTRRLKKGGYPLVHTTSLQEEKVVFDRGKVDRKLRTVCGPVILIPRVGRPNADKICLYAHTAPIVLSECVIAIKTDSLKAARVLCGLMKTHARLLLQCYVGSCAKYLTIKRLETFMVSLGVAVVLSKDLSNKELKAA